MRVSGDCFCGGEPKTTKLIHPWSGLFSARLLWSAPSCHGLAPTVCQSVLPGRENISSRLLMIINFSPVKFIFKDYMGRFQQANSGKMAKTVDS